MKTNIYILLLLSFSLLSCDPILYLDTNGQKKHNINCDCGMIEISSAVLTANLGILIKPIAINGNLEVDTDSLKIVLLPKEQYQDTKIYSSYDGKKINGKFVLEKNRNLYIGFDFEPPKKSYPSSIIILPCGYIKCNDKPLITEIIRIEFRQQKISLNKGVVMQTTPVVGQGVQTAMTVYAIGQAGVGALGMAGGAINDGWDGLGRAGKTFLGNFYLDENNWLGGVWQGFSRHTWEMPQSLVGQGYTQGRNAFGNVSRVDYFGGATFATNENSSKRDGVSIGNYININIRDEITGSFDERVLSDPLFIHEYGHTIDSRAFGLSYLFAIGIPSIISAAGDGDHSRYWTEMRANKRAKKYFRKYYGIDWNTATSPYYWGTFEDNYPTR